MTSLEHPADYTALPDLEEIAWMSWNTASYVVVAVLPGTSLTAQSFSMVGWDSYNLSDSHRAVHCGHRIASWC